MCPRRDGVTIRVTRKEVIIVPTELLTRNEKPVSTASISTKEETELRTWARAHVERVRRVKFHLAAYLLGIAVLTPIWAFVEYQDNGAFERWSDNSNPGDWEPWILYVALAWGMFVAVAALRAYFDRPTTEAEVDLELDRLKTRR
jgi:hypothetical protein